MYPYMAPELYKFPVILTQKADIYSVGVVFYRLIVHKYPIYEASFEDQLKKINKTKRIERPKEIQNDTFWDQLQMMLKFDPHYRFSATEALQHKYFTGTQAQIDTTPDQRKISKQAKKAEKKGNIYISQFDKEPSFIVEESVIKQFQQNIDSLNNEQEQDHKDKQENKDDGKDKQKQMDKYKDNTQTQQEQEQEQQQEQQAPESDAFKSALISLDFVQPSQSPTSDVLQSTLSSSSLELNHQNQTISLSYAATEEQIQAESDLFELKMSLEEIKQKLELFSCISILQRDVVCENLCRTIEGNQQNCNKAKQFGIFDHIIRIITSFSLDMIFPRYYQPFYECLIQDQSYRREERIQEGMLKFIKKILVCQNENILKYNLLKQINLINEIIKQDLIENSHQFQENFQRYGLLNKLLDIIHNNKYKDKEVKGYSACIIGIIHSAQPLPHEFSNEVINLLKNQIHSKNTDLLSSSIVALTNLTGCLDNHELILGNEFIIDMNKLINDKEELNKIENIIYLLQNLFEKGSNETKELISKEIIIPIHLVNSKYQSASLNTIQFYNLLKDHQQLNKKDGFVKQDDQNEQQLELEKDIENEDEQKDNNKA